MDDEKRDQESEERPRIKVTDRRKFAADGTLRDGARQDAAPQETTESAANAGPAVLPDAGDEGRQGADEPRVEPPPAAAESGAPSAPAGEPDGGAMTMDEDDGSRIATPQPRISELPRDFLAFIESMYFEAMLYLGAIADPRSGQIVEDPELAKYKIDLLAMLQEKTEGNLTAEEKRQLEDVLYQLRMLYLQKTKAAKL